MAVTTNAYEIQVYQNGKWEFDSYFDDRDLVLSEAERLDGAGKYSGVRVVEEIYSEETNRSDTRVIFSRLKKQPGAPRNTGRPMTVGAARGDPEVTPRYAGPRSAPSQRKGTHPIVLIAVALGIILVGIGAIIVIRQLAGVA